MMGAVLGLGALSGSAWSDFGVYTESVAFSARGFGSSSGFESTHCTSCSASSCGSSCGSSCSSCGGGCGGCS